MENSSSLTTQSFRLLRRDLPDLYTEAEMQSLATLVASAPGVRSVSKVTRHPKGGYSVIVQMSQSAIETAFVYLASNGYGVAI
jgi:hypothetical protein